MMQSLSKEDTGPGADRLWEQTERPLLWKPGLSRSSPQEVAQCWAGSTSSTARAPRVHPL